MKKLLAILAFIFVSATCLADGIKIIGRDFWVADEDLKPISFGACSWTDSDADFQLGGYVNVSLFNFWDNRLRIGIGFAGTAPDVGTIDKIDLRLVTPTVTTLLFDHLELGFYSAPFYNTMSDNDPFGFMVGYAFGF